MPGDGPHGRLLGLVQVNGGTGVGGSLVRARGAGRCGQRSQPLQPFGERLLRHGVAGQRQQDTGPGLVLIRGTAGPVLVLEVPPGRVPSGLARAAARRRSPASPGSASNGSTPPSSTAAEMAAAGSSMRNRARAPAMTPAGTAVWPSRAARASR